MIPRAFFLIVQISLMIELAGETTQMTILGNQDHLLPHVRRLHGGGHPARSIAVYHDFSLVIIRKRGSTDQESRDTPADHSEHMIVRTHFRFFGRHDYTLLDRQTKHAARIFLGRIE